jgi:hypothetical protein
MLELNEKRQAMLDREFWTLKDLAEFIGVQRQRIYKLISEETERFPEHYKRRGMWESKPAPRIYRHPTRPGSGPVAEYIEWWEKQNPVRDAERMAG